MSGCDLCGKEPIIGRGEVEGAIMAVCATCAAYAKNLRTTTGPTAPEPWTIRRRRPTPPVAATQPEPQVRPDIVAVLRAARERAGLTQEQFAAKLGVKLSTYHQYETGSLVPDLHTAKRMEPLLHLTLIVRMMTKDTPAPASDTPSKPLTFGDMIRPKS